MAKSISWIFLQHLQVPLYDPVFGHQFTCLFILTGVIPSPVFHGWPQNHER